MKKGLSYIDWSISAGLFIIYIIAIFVLLGPAFKQDHAPEYLGSIIKEGLEKNTTLELKRIPMYMMLTITEGSPPSQTENFKFILNNLPKELEEVTDSQLTIYSNSSEILTKDLVYSNDILSFNSTLNYLEIPSQTGEFTKKLWLFVSPEEIFNDESISGIIWTDLNNTFGVAETIKGIYKPDFLNFSSKDYNKTKQTLNYPKQRDFSILVYNETKLNETPILYYEKEIPGEKDAVNVLLWSSWLIHNNTKKTPVTVLIKTW